MYKLEGLGKLHVPLPEKDAHTSINYTLHDYTYKADMKKWMRALGISLKNYSRQTHLYQDSDVHMKKKQLTNKTYKIEEMVIAQNFTVFFVKIQAD